MEVFPELGAPAEQAERDDRLQLPQTAGDVPDSGPNVPLLSPDRPLQQQRQVPLDRLVSAQTPELIFKPECSEFFNAPWAVLDY